MPVTSDLRKISNNEDLESIATFRREESEFTQVLGNLDLENLVNINKNINNYLGNITEVLYRAQI